MSIRSIERTTELISLPISRHGARLSPRKYLLASPRTKSRPTASVSVIFPDLANDRSLYRPHDSLWLYRPAVNDHRPQSIYGRHQSLRLNEAGRIQRRLQVVNHLYYTYEALQIPFDALGLDMSQFDKSIMLQGSLGFRRLLSRTFGDGSETRSS